MSASRLERGAIVRRNDKTWIVWAYPRERGHADPIALPVMHQTAPRHRSQVRLDLGGKPVLAHLLDPVSLRHRDCQPIGQCSADTVAMLAASMQRAVDASASEQHR